MFDILVIQNAKYEGLSNLGKLLEEDGFKTNIIFAKKEKIPEVNHSGVVILGAPESANDDLLYLKKEIGIYHDIEFDNITSGLFSGIKSPATVFHWHGDTFDLPPNSTRLAHSRDYQNQAFQIGSAVGVQFHLEVDEETIKLWLEKSKDELSKTQYIDPEEIISRLPENIETIQNNMKIFYQNFKSKFNL